MALGSSESIHDFVNRLGLAQEASDYLWSLPDDVQEKVTRSFSSAGTKDGNLLPRLQAFANSILKYSGSAGVQAQQQQQQQQPQQPQRAPWSSPQQATYSASEHLTESVRQFVGRLGLDAAGTQFLQALPEDVQGAVMSDFDLRGTKDGNVFGRLLGFARAVWLQRLGLDPQAKAEATSLLRSMPEGAQARVMEQFDCAGTKDGNVLARLQRFAQGVASRFSGAAPAQPPPVRVMAPPLVAAQPAYGGYQGPPSQRRAAQYTPASAAWAAPRPGACSQYAGGPVVQFAQKLGLDSTAVNFLSALPQDVACVVFNSFDPSGTKDGNVWGRLFGFVRSVWSQRLGLDINMVSFIKSLPQETQQVVMTKFDPSRTKDGNVAARLENFAHSVAASSYRSGAAGGGGGTARSGTGAVLPPPLRQVAPPWQQQQQQPWQQQQQQQPWQQQVAQQQQQPRQQPQLLVPRIRQQAVLPPPMLSGPRAPSYASTAQQGSPLEDFLQKWSLTEDAGTFLRSMPEGVQAVVLASFRPSGTKDGNVWGRLFGFVRSVWSRRMSLATQAFSTLRAMTEESQMAVMMRFNAEQEDASEVAAQIQAVAAEVDHVSMDGQPGNYSDQAYGAVATSPDGADEDDAAVNQFVARCGLASAGGAAEQLLLSLDAECRAAVISDFDSGSSKDGNVLARLRGFVNAVENRRKRLRGEEYGRNVRPRYG